MGFSGGVKSAAIGVTAQETINTNHAWMSDRRSGINRYDDNLSCRVDVEEIGRLIGVDYALNAVLNEDKGIVHALAGDPVDVMRRGIPLLREIYQREVAAPYDLMIVSAGGHPKDINLYQGQKALGHSSLVMREGGTVILAIACPEGTGSRAYEEWILAPGMTSHAAVLERYGREGFRIGPHKAWQLARDGSRVRVLFLSDMAPTYRRLLLEPVASWTRRWRWPCRACRCAHRHHAIADATIPCYVRVRQETLAGCGQSTPGRYSFLGGAGRTACCCCTASQRRPPVRPLGTVSAVVPTPSQGRCCRATAAGGPESRGGKRLGA